MSKYKKTKAIHKPKPIRRGLETPSKTIASAFEPKQNTLRFGSDVFNVLSAKATTEYNPQGLLTDHNLSIHMKWDNPRIAGALKCGVEMNIELGYCGEILFGKGYIKEYKVTPDIKTQDFFVEAEIVFTTPPNVK